ncbi:MAG TPA: glycoside hydrolase family 2 TIM barrel-domain containing protein [Azospirillaceae bacterium]|nr:glycoside hydrolase family 2 TIM barrel-domain containing protein [Azospirillaceae bacterium]
MIRERIDLDGAWEFQMAGDDDACPAEGSVWCAAVVPGPWQAQFDDLRMTAGTAWYRRSFDVPASWEGGAVYLRFNAVNYHARVWVNGQLVGEHEGAWLPFEFEVSRHLRLGAANEVEVRVVLPTDDAERFPDFPFTEIPFGKQSWYGPLGGIWQSVRLERRSALHVAGIRLLPSLADGTVTVRVALSQPAPDRVDLEMDVTDAAGIIVATTEIALMAGDTSAEAMLHVPDPAPWSPDAPNLYRLTTVLEDDTGELDRQSDSFGFRTIEARDGRLFLNGAPIYLRGALDQDYYPDGICTAPSLAFLEDQMRKAKELGLNCLRCHIKVPDPRYYEVADRMGMLIWTELPNGGRVTDASVARAEATLRGILERDGNHPSIVCWTIINENWGTDLVHDATHRDWLKRTFTWLKATDPSRLVVDNSPLAPSLHVQTDIEDYHFYAGVPDHRRDWDRFVEGFASRADYTFSHHGDAVRTGREPLIVSEFGNWGLPHPADLVGSDGQEPWWFETGHDWGEGVMYAHGVERRFRDWYLNGVFGSFRNFIEAAQWQQFRAFKYELESLRRRPEIAGYVMTELTDCHWESNGLLDMRRNTRVFHDVFRTVNADTVIVPEWRRVAYWDDEAVSLDLAIAHGAGPLLTGAKVEMRLDEMVEALVPPLSAGEVRNLGGVELELAPVDRPTTRRVELTLRSASGDVVAENHVEIAVHPRRRPPTEAAAIWAPDPAVRDRLAILGYTMADNLNGASAVVTEHMEQDFRAFVREGGAMLFLADHPTPLYPFFPHWQNVKVESRDGTLWRGDWASSFSWLRRSGPFTRLPGGPLLDHGFDRVIPRHVISGCNLIDFQSRVHAGLVVGWVHKPVALTVERQYGRGRLVASTFRLFADPAGVDPTATALLDGMIELTVQGRRCGAARPSETEAHPSMASA